MKPDINLDSPIVKLALSFHQKEVATALQIEQTVERAVIPIATIPKTRAHRGPKKKPEQIGSGVLVNIKDQYFVFSSTHVFMEFEGKSFFTSTSDYSLIEELGGERYSTGRLDKKVDKFDATVFHIQNEFSSELKKTAIGLEDIDFEENDENHPVFMITGFRTKDSNTAGNEVKSKIKNFPTIEFEDYDSLGIDKKGQILLSYENQILVNGKWQSSPKPKGMSGGAIIKAQGTCLNFKKLKDLKREPERQLLTAITIEQHKDKGDRLGYVLGTRINVFLGVIHQFFPGLLDDFLNAEAEK